MRRALGLATRAKVDNIRTLVCHCLPNAHLSALVAQLVEQVTLNHRVQGSSPCGGIYGATEPSGLMGFMGGMGIM